MGKTSIIGAYNTAFGNFVKKDKETKEITDLKSIYELIEEAGEGAIQDAEIEAKDIDGIWLGSCSPSLFTNQEHLAPWAIEAAPEALRFVPCTRTEDACASSSVALYNAIYAVESGRCRTALVVGVEKMNLLNTKAMTHALACSSHWASEGSKGMTFPGLFAEYAEGYQSQYKISDKELERMLATVAALGYRNGRENPLAHFGKGSLSDRLKLFSAQAIIDLPEEKNPMIAPPLRLHDCSLVSDGAAGLIITSKENARAIKKDIVEIAGFAHTTERLPMNVRPNMYELIAGKEARKKAFNEAGISPTDIDIAEVHDCFTINQLLCTEALGLSKDGRAGYDYMEGQFTRDDDRCSVNLSGGLKAKGHPVGATGASMHALIYKQLVGEPIGVAPTKGNPEIGVTLNVGGSSVTNCVTVLRRVQ